MLGIRMLVKLSLARHWKKKREREKRRKNRKKRKKKETDPYLFFLNTDSCLWIQAARRICKFANFQCICIYLILDWLHYDRVISDILNETILLKYILTLLRSSNSSFFFSFFIQSQSCPKKKEKLLMLSIKTSILSVIL